MVHRGSFALFSPFPHRQFQLDVDETILESYSTICGSEATSGLWSKFKPDHDEDEEVLGGHLAPECLRLLPHPACSWKEAALCDFLKVLGWVHLGNKRSLHPGILLTSLSLDIICFCWFLGTATPPAPEPPPLPWRESCGGEWFHPCT